LRNRQDRICRARNMPYIAARANVARVGSAREQRAFSAGWLKDAARSGHCSMCLQACRIEPRQFPFQRRRGSLIPNQRLDEVKGGGPQGLGSCWACGVGWMTGNCLSGSRAASRGIISSMNGRGPEDFTCPQCKSRYKLVRVKPRPRTTNRPVHCKVCRHHWLRAMAKTS
jgi:hypothetical protein